METASQLDIPPRPLSRVGGNLALDFVNTVDYALGPSRFDHLAQPERIMQWAEGADLLPAGMSPEAPVGRFVDRVHDLRSLLRSVFEGVARQGELSAEPLEWRQVRAYFAEAISHAELMPGEGQFELRWHCETPAEMLWPIVHSAVQLLTGPQAGRIKQCAGCPWLFLDRSKNHSRRWCEMGECGTSEKSRRYVERRRANASASIPATTHG